MFHAVIDWPTSWLDCVREDGYGFSVNSYFCLSCDAFGNSPLRRKLRRLNAGLKWRSRQSHGGAMIKDRREFAPERSLGASADNGKNKMFVYWVACLGVRADIISKVTSQKALCHIVVLPASQPPRHLPAWDGRSYFQSAPLPHYAKSKKGLLYWCSVCWILTVFIHLLVAFRRQEGEEASAQAKATTGLNVLVLRRRKG